MNILVIGATRGIGKAFSQQAANAGHNVTILARNPEKAPGPTEHLQVLKGDIIDAESVHRAVKGQDAVAITVGMNPSFRTVTMFSQGTKNVIRAMKARGVNNLICVTGIGAGDSRGRGGFFYDKIFLPLFLKTIYEDKDRQEKMIKESGMNWLIIRPGMLTKGPATGNYRILTDMNRVMAGKISRMDVAHFMLNQVSSMTYAEKTPVIIY